MSQRITARQRNHLPRLRTSPSSVSRAASPSVVTQTGSAAFDASPRAELLIPRPPMLGCTGCMPGPSVLLLRGVGAGASLIAVARVAALSTEDLIRSMLCVAGWFHHLQVSLELLVYIATFMHSLLLCDTIERASFRC